MNKDELYLKYEKEQAEYEAVAKLAINKQKELDDLVLKIIEKRTLLFDTIQELGKLGEDISGLTKEYADTE